MDITILNEQLKEKYSDEILSMLSVADKDFVPPLSARNSTTQSDFSSPEKNKAGILNYFDEMKKQKIMIATENGNLIAFLSFKENYTSKEIKAEYLPNIYLSTLVVKPEYRGRKITQTMYESLFDKYKNGYIFTRTWSENAAHIKLLSKFNFDTLCVLKDDRGIGIDTVYFIKKCFNKNFNTPAPQS